MRTWPALAYRMTCGDRLFIVSFIFLPHMAAVNSQTKKGCKSCLTRASHEPRSRCTREWRLLFRVCYDPHERFIEVSMLGCREVTCRSGADEGILRRRTREACEQCGRSVQVNSVGAVSHKCDERRRAVPTTRDI